MIHLGPAGLGLVITKTYTVNSIAQANTTTLEIIFLVEGETAGQYET